MDFFVWNADPVLVTLGGIRLHWYGVMFAIAIVSSYLIMQWIYHREGKNVDSLDGLFMYAIAGGTIGARLGHCFFYEPAFYLSNPLQIIAIWEGGLASHGAGIGGLLALYIYHKRSGIDYLWLLDKLAIPTGLICFLIRIGNFFNSEIIGIHTNVSWAIIFQRIDNLPRHPTQLYEAFSYFIIFTILMSLYRFSNIKQRKGTIFGLLVFLVFSARFLLEFVKTKQAAYSTDLLLSTGQILSIPFLIVGMVLIIRASVKYRHSTA